MKPFTYTIKEPLARGLAPNSNPRNSPYLVESKGALPYEEVLMALEEFSAIDTSGLYCVWPFPQLFVFPNFIVVCNDNKIYEYASDTLTLKITVSGNLTWKAVEFKDYLYFTNGEVAVTRKDGVWAVDTTVPYGSCVCNCNGQVLIGSPNVHTIPPDCLIGIM